MISQRYNRGGFIGGAILIGLGLLFLLAQLFNFQAWGLLWPFFVVGVGGLFFMGMLTGGKPAAGLAIPGSIIGGIGLTLLVQNATGHWSSWAYSSTVIILSVGVGLWISGWWGDHPTQCRVGLRLMETGLVLFVIFGAFFELVLGAGFGGSPLQQAFFPALLVLTGLYLIVRRDALWPGWFSAPGSGQVITESRSVAGFQEVAFSAIGDLTIQPGESEALNIEAEDNLLPAYQTEVRNNTLYISMPWASVTPHVWPTQPIRLSLTVKRLVRLDFSGAGKTLIRDLKTDQLQADLSGAGTLRLEGLDAQQLSCTLSGAGSLTAAGRAEHTQLAVSGVGAFHGQDLQCASATASLSGTGGVTLWVTGDLQADISGVGTLGYYGHPTVTQKVSGIGRVRSLGDKN